MCKWTRGTRAEPSAIRGEMAARDLRQYEIRPKPNANELHGASRVGSKYEFVTAVSLVVRVDRLPSGPSLWWSPIVLG